MKLETGSHQPLPILLSRILKGFDQQSHFIETLLHCRFNKEIAIDNEQGTMTAEFQVENLVYCVTAAPSRNVLLKCAENLRAGLHPILLIPREQENKVRYLAQDEGIDQELTIISIESFIALNIIEMATDENKDFFSVLKEIVEIYNARLSDVETDLSLRIEVH